LVPKKQLTPEERRKRELELRKMTIEEKIKAKRMSKEATVKARKELKKLKMMSPMSAEATVVRNYIDWILSLPWAEYTEDKLDIVEAERVLDEDPSVNLVEFFTDASIPDSVKRLVVPRNLKQRLFIQALHRYDMVFAIGPCRSTERSRPHSTEPYPRCKKYYFLWRGFHGRTLGALSATWNKNYRQPFEPLVPDFHHVPYNNLSALSNSPLHK
jgi:hypothetical protein